MILSRVVARLREQQWTSVFIELAIVVLGVFIGIQASNWNAAQADRKKGEQFAARLLQDLRDDLAGRERMLAYYREVNAGAEKTVALLDSAAPDAKALVVSAYRATEMNYYTTLRATWDEVVSSGDLGILPAQISLRDISMYYNFDASKDIKSEFERSPYRSRVRRLIPHAVQEAIRADCSDAVDDVNYIIAFKPDCKLAVSDAELAAAATALLHDPEIVPDLRLHFTAIRDAVNNIGGDVALLKRAIASFDPKANRSAKP